MALIYTFLLMLIIIAIGMYLTIPGTIPADTNSRVPPLIPPITAN